MRRHAGGSSRFRVFRLPIRAAATAIIAAAATVIAVATLPAGPSAPQGIRIGEKNGVTLVRNPNHPVAIPGRSGTLRLVPELTIGKESDSEDAMIFTLRGFRVDDHGTIYVLDDKVDRIKVYGPDGAHLRTFGRKGQGPGEFGTLNRIDMTAEGNLYLQDLGNNRVAVYSPDGECLRETPLTKWRPFGLVPDSRGFAYGDVLDMERGIAHILLKLDRNNEKVATAATLTILSNPSESMAPVEFFRIIYQVDREDRLIWASTGEYVFHVVDADGKPVKTIERDYRTRGYTKEEKRELEKSRFGESGPPQGAVLFYSDHRPVLDSFVVDDEGNIFARTNDLDADGAVIHEVFDKDGRFFARFTLPEEERLTVVKRGKAYCGFRENPEGIPQVKRYAMIWE